MLNLFSVFTEFSPYPRKLKYCAIASTLFPFRCDIFSDCNIVLFYALYYNLKYILSFKYNFNLQCTFNNMSQTLCHRLAEMN